MFLRHTTALCAAIVLACSLSAAGPARAATDEYAVKPARFCLVNKGWVVWSGVFMIRRHVSNGGGGFKMLTTEHHFNLALHKSECIALEGIGGNYDVSGNFTPVGNGPTDYRASITGDATLRLDGTALSYRLTKSAGVNLD